jgi:lysophospholipase L1-like esterase
LTISDTQALCLVLAGYQIKKYTTDNKKDIKDTLFVIMIGGNDIINIVRDISTVFEEIKHLRSRAPENILPDY